MADALDSLVPVAIRVAIAGFTSSAWHVRNSSVMLYAAGKTYLNDVKECVNVSEFIFLLAGIERAVGYNQRNAHEDDRGAGVTTGQFFSRFPQLHPLLLAGLRHCTAEAFSADGAAWVVDPACGAGSQCIVPSPSWLPSHHPSLHPLLLLLSRLRPEVAVGLTTLQSVAPFVPLIRLAAWQRHVFVRRMAARALAALLPDEELPETVRSVCEAIATAVVLPITGPSPFLLDASQGGIPRVPASAPSDEKVLLASHNIASATVPRSWDSLHGTLLQLNALLARMADGRLVRDLRRSAGETPTGGAASMLAAALVAVQPALKAIKSEALLVPAVVVGESQAALSTLVELTAGPDPDENMAASASGAVRASDLSPRLLGGCLHAAEAGRRLVYESMRAIFDVGCDPVAPARTATANHVIRISNAVLATDEDRSCGAMRQLCDSLVRHERDLPVLWQIPLAEFDSTRSAASGLLASLLELLSRDNPHPEATRLAASAAALLLTFDCELGDVNATQLDGAVSLLPATSFAAKSHAEMARDPRSWAVILRAHDVTRDGDLRTHCLRALGPLTAQLREAVNASMSLGLQRPEPQRFGVAGAPTEPPPTTCTAQAPPTSASRSLEVHVALSLVVPRALAAMEVVPSFALRLAGVFALRVSGALVPG